MKKKIMSALKWYFNTLAEVYRNTGEIHYA